MLEAYPVRPLKIFCKCTKLMKKVVMGVMNESLHGQNMEKASSFVQECLLCRLCVGYANTC